jgi:lipoate-protein ligase A
MKLLDLTLPSPAENLALDEALLNAAEANPEQDEILRLWEPECGPAVPAGQELPSDVAFRVLHPIGQPTTGGVDWRPTSDRGGRTTLFPYFVVVGRSSQVAIEVNLAACRQLGAGVLRRSSGGAAVVAGPGCLMYAVVLSYERRPHLRMLDQAHHYVLSTVAQAIRGLGLEVEQRGTSDLVWGDRKVSGNSLRCKRDHFLYHGTVLYNFDLPRIGELLGSPPRQPDYRRNRPHHEFLANLPATGPALRAAIAEAFGASQPLAEWPQDATRRLVASRYGRDDWNLGKAG